MLGECRVGDTYLVGGGNVRKGFPRKVTFELRPEGGINYQATGLELGGGETGWTRLGEQNVQPQEGVSTFTGWNT